MAWTTPMTFVSGRVLTAAQLNTHLRDNLLETLPARCTQAGEHFTVDDKGRILPRLAGKSTVLTSETLASSSDYSDLATVGPSLSITTGDTVMVYMGCHTLLGLAGQAQLMSVEVTAPADSTGAAGNTIAPDDSYAFVHQGDVGEQLQGSHHVLFLAVLTPGVNTFTAKYKVQGGGTGTFLRRRISVMSIN